MHYQILKRVGIILVVIGAADIAYMIYCLSNQSSSYSSSFNIFAIIAGVFLIKGSLNTASLVRWFAAFMLSGFITLLVMFPASYPIDLILLHIELNPANFAVSCIFMIFVSALLYWLVKELGKHEIIEASKAEGGKIRNIKFAIGSGVSLVVLLTVFFNVLLHGESAGKASAIALKEVGSGYKAHVTSLNIFKNGGGTSAVGRVTVWNDKEIKIIPVSWQE